MPEHTPGPWEYHRPTLTNPSAWIFGQDERPICELNDNRNEYEANARLIAAAPELLKALKSLLSECEIAWCYDEEEDGTPPNIETARAAIAKAEGGVLDAVR